MKVNLPTVPPKGTAISIQDLEDVEASVAKSVAEISDLETLQEWRAQAAALEAYLRGRDLAGPMLGAQRRVEARIGQLLGDAHEAQCRPGGALPSAVKGVSPQDRNRFRILARGLEHGLPDYEWRSARDPLIKIIQQRWPMPRKVTTTVTEAGQVRKPRDEREAEIAELALDGYKASQIAKKLNISESRVRGIARDAGIILPDKAIGKRARLDARRILIETVEGCDAYVSGLSLLSELPFPNLTKDEVNSLAQALMRSLNGLRKLRVKLEDYRERLNSTAA